MLASSIACTCVTAADTEFLTQFKSLSLKEIPKKYSPWVKAATTISIYSDRGIFLAEVPITQNPSLDTVKKCLKKALRIKIDYSLHPLYNQTWRFGQWNYSSELLSQDHIKDCMEQYDTNQFWIKVKQRKPHQS